MTPEQLEKLIVANQRPLELCSRERPKALPRLSRRTYQKVEKCSFCS